MFEFCADKSRLTVKKREPAVSGSRNVYQARFSFSPDWDGLSRTAVFRSGGETVSVLLDETDACPIPWEVLVKPKVRLMVGVYGTQGEDVVLPTVWADCGFILEGAAPGKDTQPPTPDVCQQILAAAQTAVEIARSVRDDADAGLFMGPEGPRGEQGPQGEKGPAGSEGPAGADGVSPAVSFSEIPGGSKMTVKDAAGEKSVNIMNGEPGRDGKDGENGQPGENGAPGVSPSVSTELVTGGYKLKISDADHSETVEIWNGKDGAAGEPGPAGLGLPFGGEDGQIIAKDGGEPYKTKWIDPPGGGTEFATDGTLSMSEDNILGVAAPVNGVISQEDFDALPPEKQNHGLYIVKTEGHPLQGVEIEEYDTIVDGCNWHVRKWSNGYCEMFGRKRYTGITTNTEWPPGSKFFTTESGFNIGKFPLHIVEIMEETYSLSDSSPLLLTFTGRESEDSCSKLNILRNQYQENLFATFNVHITGRWK